MSTISKRTALVSIAAVGVVLAGISVSAAQTPAGAGTSAGVSAAGTAVTTKAKKTKSLTVQVEAAAGAAAVGNALPADILVVVTDPTTGSPSIDLGQGSFVVINHFSHPGQSCGFSNNVVGFNNVGTGAYHLQVAPQGCNWARGDFLLQVMVSSGLKRGQAVAKFEVTAAPA